MEGDPSFGRVESINTVAFWISMADGPGSGESSGEKGVHIGGCGDDMGESVTLSFGVVIDLLMWL